MLWQNDGFNDCDVLSDAIKNLRYRQAHLLVKSGTNINIRDSCGRTPLIMISIYFSGFDNWYNREKFAKLLLDANADPNLCDKYGLTPLMHASINGQYDYVALLLSYAKADYELCDKAGNNAIMLAARYGQVEVLQEFKDHIMSKRSFALNILDNKNYDHKCALDLAYEGNYYECVSLLTTLRAALTDKQLIIPDEELINNSNTLSLQNKSVRLTNLNLLAQSSQNDSVVISKKSNDLNRNNNRSIKNIKLPPINGKRLVGYSEWTQNNKLNNDRKTI